MPSTITFTPGNLLISRSVYSGVASSIIPGVTVLPNGSIAVANDSYTNVWSNETPDPSFGITSPIFLDQITTSGTLVGNSLNVTNVLQQQGINLSTSFPSKSELGLNLSSDGTAITFMAYLSAPQALDISNSNTPAVIDPTNPVNALGILTTQRAVVQFDDNFNLQVTPVNAYSGNNGRNAVLGNNGYYYMVGNAGNGGNITLPTTAIATTNAGVTTISNSDNSPFINILVGQTITGTNIPTTNPVTITSVSADKKSFTISTPATGAISNVKIIQTGTTLTDLSNNTGVQTIKAGDTTGNTTVVGQVKGTAGSTTGYQRGFSIADLGLSADKTGKDDNLRGLTLNPFDNSLYVSKGSGGNGVNTVYKVTPTGSTLPTLANAGTSTITILPGFSTTPANSTTGVIYHPFGLWFANPTTLYVADEGTPLKTTGTGAVPITNAALDTNAGLEKWSLVNGVWVQDYTLQNGLNLGIAYNVANGPNGEVYPTSLNPAIAGLRNITGKVNSDGTVSIYAVTSTASTEVDQGADPNTIVAITDNLGFTTNAQAANESFTTIANASYGNVYRGVSFTPTVSTPFSGVAAGDATANDAILWTRTFDPQTKLGVNTNLIAQVSTDANFATIAFSYNVPARTDGLDHDGTAKVDATGLQSGTKYYYRFVTTTGDISPVGTFKTSPEANASVAVRFGFSGDADGLMRPYSSTQNFGSLNLDFFGFLGDTIYETASSGSPAAATTNTATPSQLLTDYHLKYLQNIQPVSNNGFSSLETLFSSQGNYTLLDNHELGNKELINGGAPASLATGSGNGIYAQTSADAVNTGNTFINQTATFKALEQAYSDYQPIKEQIISAPNDPRTNGTQQLYGSHQWGKNLVYINTDTRSYRDVRLKQSNNSTDNTGDLAADPNRTMLGKTQLAWLKQTLLDAQNNGTVWKFVAVSDPIDQIGAIPTGVGLGDDGGKSWIGGYRAERNDLLKFIADHGIKNVVFLATDDHQNRINELTYLDNINDPTSVRVLPNALSIVDGPLGATGPDSTNTVINGSHFDFLNDHSFANIQSAANALAAGQIAAGVNPVGLDPNFLGLKNVVREGDPNANINRSPVDFYSPDTFNYTTFDISADGKTLNVNVQGINSYATNTFPEPSTANPVRSILSFSIDAAPTNINLGISPANVLEDSGNSIVYTFTRDSSVGASTVNFNVGGNATFNTDYTVAGANTFTSNAGSVNFANGANTATVTITPIANNIVEANKTVALTLISDSNNKAVTTTPVTGTILNDDAYTYGITASTASLLEGNSGTTPVSFTVTRNQTGLASSVAYTITGTATNNSDYTNLQVAGNAANITGVINFAANENSKTISMDVVGDTNIEFNETIIATLSNVGTITPPSNFSSNTATITILNDDVPQTGNNLIGTSGNDSLTGTTGNDTLSGLDGVDSLTGLSGNDILIGGLGADILDGGAGADTFVYNALNESLSTASDRLITFNQLEGDRFGFAAGIKPTGLFNAGVLAKTSYSTVNAAIAAAYTNKNQAGAALGLNEAVLFGWNGREYLAVNNGVAGFQAANDLVLYASSFTFKAGDSLLGTLNVPDYFS